MYRQNVKRRQDGFSLLIALVFLLILTVLGMVAMRSATLQEKMTGHSRDKTIAFLAAEAGLRDAEVYLATGDILPTASATVSRVANINLPQSASQTAMLISCVNACEVSAGRVYYRVNVTGFGARRSTQTRLESVMWVEE